MSHSRQFLYIFTSGGRERSVMAHIIDVPLTSSSRDVELLKGGGLGLHFFFFVENMKEERERKINVSIFLC